MRAAFIAPTPLLNVYSALSNYHLCLTHEIVEYPEYERFYRNMGRRGDFVILDNSAHEMKASEPVETLARVARIINPTEVVLPDVLFDADQTVARSTAALPRLRELGKRLMAVPQAQTADEWEDCCTRLIDQCHPDTIGISKDYETWEGGLLRLLEWVTVNFPHQEIHMLGWGRDLSAIREFSNFPQVRGIDSAKPLVYAAAGIKLSEVNSQVGPQYPGRPDNYFELTSLPCRIALKNINVFRGLAKDYKRPEPRYNYEGVAAG